MPFTGARLEVGIRKQKTHPVLSHRLPEVLKLLDGVVRCANVDDAKIVNHVHVLVLLVCRAQTAFVLIEQEMAAVGRVGVRELRGDIEHLWVGPTDGFADIVRWTFNGRFAAGGHFGLHGMVSLQAYRTHDSHVR